MSRAVVVVLFTDLVGSTELRGRLGEEAADELRRRHDQLLTQAVEANNGRVVKGLGDGIMATFAGASDAVAAAVAIQQGIDRLNRTGKAPVPLAVRVGLSAGDVAFEHDDVHGTPVIEAARLCTAATGGEILAAEVVRVLAGASTERSYVSVGPLELKGLDHPVAAVRVGWEPAVVSSLPMPQLLTDVGRIFVGRDAELERLGQLWKEAAAGERRVALLAGEPGVGKTRLAAAIAIQAHEQGGGVLAGRCDEDLGVPYQPFVEALRHFVDNTRSADLRDALGRYGGELARLVPELADVVPDLPAALRSDPETERYRLFDALAAWLAAASAQRPLLLVLDDLQWAAKPTLLLFRHIVRFADPTGLLIVATYRDTELGHDHPLVEVLADLRRQGDVVRLSLPGLDQPSVATFVAQAAGHELDEDGLTLARAVHEETEGNPFFVKEVLRHLAESGAIARQAGRWATSVEDLGIPEGVREVVGKRLSRLSGDANRVLRTAAVVGPTFEPAVVLVAGESQEEEVTAALEEATAARLVVEAGAGRYRFAHALVRDTLYQGLSAVRRSGLHRRVAEAIEALYADGLDDQLPALAHHWGRAAVPRAEARRAVDYAVRAGDRALNQLAHDEAAAYYRQALELLDAGGARDQGRHVGLLILLGEAQRRAGDPTHRQTLLDATELARQRGDVDALARAALANGRGSLYSSALLVDAERVASLEAALEAAGEVKTAIRARLMANLAMELTFSGQREKRGALSDEALRIARQLDDPATLAHVLTARIPTIWEPNTLADRLADSAELIRVAARLDDPVMTARAHWLSYRMTVEAGDLEAADRHIAVAATLAAQLGQPTLSWMVTWSRGGRALLAGYIDEAEALFTEAFELGQRSGQPDGGPYFATQQLRVRFEQGRLGELVSSFADVYARRRAPMVAALLAELYAEIGEDDDARRMVQNCGPPDDLPLDSAWMITLLLSAAVAHQVHDAERAESLYRLLVPFPDQLSIAGGFTVGCVVHYLGLLASTLGRFGEAEGHFAAAQRAHARLRAPTWLARTRLEWARMVLNRRQPGDADRARDLLGQALTTARELGLAKVERDAVALLGECP